MITDIFERFKTLNEVKMTKTTQQQQTSTMINYNTNIKLTHNKLLQYKRCWDSDLIY
jgi:hypothetical protein